MNIKSLNIFQAYQAQKFCFYNFQTDYYLKKANRAVDTLFYFLQKSFKKKKNFVLKILEFYIIYGHY